MRSVNESTVLMGARCVPARADRVMDCSWYVLYDLGTHRDTRLQTMNKILVHNELRKRRGRERTVRSHMLVARTPDRTPFTDWDGSLDRLLHACPIWVVCEYLQPIDRLAELSSAARAGQLFSDALTALHSLHNEGFAHADVSLHNMGRDADARLRLLDMGSAHRHLLAGGPARLPVVFSRSQYMSARLQNRRKDSDCHSHPADDVESLVYALASAALGCRFSTADDKRRWACAEAGPGRGQGPQLEGHDGQREDWTHLERSLRARCAACMNCDQDGPAHSVLYERLA